MGVHICIFQVLGVILERFYKNRFLFMKTLYIVNRPGPVCVASHLSLKFPAFRLRTRLTAGFQSKQNNNSGKFQTQMTSDMENIMLPYFLNKVIMNGL